MPGENPTFQLKPENPDNETASPPESWEIVRLEDQSRRGGKFDPAARKWSPSLDVPGSYSLMLRDAQGNLVAATSHWVGGQGIQVIPGTLEMVVDKERYQPGETAEVLLSFSDPVDEALLTLERDKVESAALLSAARNGGANWVKVERLAPNQWRARIPVREDYAPNMTFSAVYVKNGEYVFQNAGLVVDTPKLALDIKPGQSVALPGETVTVDINVSLKGKPARAMLTVSIVDEAIYNLQPEIAPDMVEFFQHVRRNNVRTGASLNFIAYDEAANYADDAARQPSALHQYNGRALKVLERARRDDTDTAAWQPALLTDENGHARFSFKMPDALSRWRITVRAVALDKTAQENSVSRRAAPRETTPPRGAANEVSVGAVPVSRRAAPRETTPPRGAANEVSVGALPLYGQSTAWLRSDKPLYGKWTSPDWMREGDTPVASLAVFNNTEQTRDAEILLKLAGQEITQKATLPRGVSYLPFQLPPFTGEQTARLEIRAEGKTVDALETPVKAEPVRWRGVREQIVELERGERGAGTLALPADARHLSLHLAAGGSEHFLRIADALIEYPWGCVEQTSSRLIPLAIATPLLAPDRAQGKTAHLWQTLYSQRLRLAALAGPNAVFGWWHQNDSTNALMTAYAYYADWRAAKTLGITLPAEHWEHVLEVYRDHADNEPVLHRALALWFIQKIGLPVRTQTEGLLAALDAGNNTKDKASDDTEATSPILGAPDSALGLAYARVLASVIAAETGLKANADALASAKQRLQASAQPSAHALRLLADDGKAGKANEAAAILAGVTESTPTIDRALALVWTQQALGDFTIKTSGAKPGGKWQALTDTRFGQTEWRWPAGERLPDTLQISDAPPGALTAILRFESEDPGKSALPVTIKRTLYRLEQQTRAENAPSPSPAEKGFANYALVPVNPGDGLSAQELYLDEIHLSSPREHRYGIIEAPLPPGAAIERSTWGINLIGEEGENAQPIDRSRAEERRDRYGVPVETLPAGETLVLRHLLRVGQTGRFTLPPVRYYQMYQPEKKAYAGGNTVWRIGKK